IDVVFSLDIFFFQAEDGIRDKLVTGVQTCALPIFDVVSEPQRAKRLMGITPQEAGTFDTLKVREHLQLFARLKGLSRRVADAATVDVIDTLGLADHAERPVGSLSGGLRRRILIGLAMLGRP